MWVRLSIVLMALCGVFVGCGKDSSADNSSGPVRDSIAPAVTVNAPSDQQQYASGEEVFVKGSATDETNVTEMHIHISDEVKGKLLRDIHAYPISKTGIIQDSFPAASGIHYLIKVIAYDAAQNIGVAQVEIQGN